MNAPKDDPHRQALAPLRELRAPDEARERIEAATLAALREAAPVPWYRKRVSVPVPLAAAALLALVVVPLLMRGGGNGVELTDPGDGVADRTRSGMEASIARNEEPFPHHAGAHLGDRVHREIATDVFEVPGLGVISQRSVVTVTEGGVS